MLQAQVAPIYWSYDVRSTNILVLLVLAAPIGEDTQTFYNLKNFADFLNVCSANILVLTGLQHQYQPIQICLPRGKVYSFWRIFSPCFLHGDWYGSTPTPSPVSKGRNQIYSVIWLHSHPPLPPANRKIFKKEKCCNYLQHHAYSVKRCLFNLLE